MRRLLFAPVLLAALLAGGATRVVQDQCGPFTDVTPGFCPYVLELYYLGITAGTSATTFSPEDPLTRGQGAVFIAKGLNQSLARSSRRAALGQWWTTTPHYDLGLGVTTLTPTTRQVVSDGVDLWVVAGASVVHRVRASDGKLLETWTGATGAYGIVAAMGRIFVTGGSLAGRQGTTQNLLYMIDPGQPAGPVTTVAVTDSASNPTAISFDGSRFWLPRLSDGSVTIVTPGPTLPWAVTNITGFNLPIGILFDGSNVWVSDVGAGDILKLDADGSILQTVHTGAMQFIGFDGANIWVPGPTSVTVVSAATGAILATLTGNGVDGGNSVAFDGQRVMVMSPNTDTVSLWSAADFSPLGFFSTGSITLPYFACSDGINFWISLGGTGQLARY